MYSIDIFLTHDRKKFIVKVIDMNRNNKLRQEFHQYLEDNFKPNVYLITKHIGITNSYVNEWLKEKRDMGDVALDKIEKFLKEYNR